MKLWPRKKQQPAEPDPFLPSPQEEQKRKVYCIVPEDLAPKLFETLRRHYAKDPDIEVIVERRKAERRSGEERRKKNVGPPPGVEDRRRIRNEDGRRIAERRAELIPVEPPEDVPRKVRKYLAYPGDEDEEGEGEAEEQEAGTEEQEAGTEEQEVGTEEQEADAGKV